MNINWNSPEQKPEWKEHVFILIKHGIKGHCIHCYSVIGVFDYCDSGFCNHKNCYNEKSPYPLFKSMACHVDNIDDTRCIDDDLILGWISLEDLENSYDKK